MIDIFTQACYRERGPGLALSSALGTQMRGASLFFSLEAAFSLFLSFEREREGPSLRFLTQFYFHFLRCPKELAANFFFLSLLGVKKEKENPFWSHTFLRSLLFWLRNLKKKHFSIGRKEAISDDLVSETSEREKQNCLNIFLRDSCEGKLEPF